MILVHEQSSVLGEPILHVGFHSCSSDVALFVHSESDWIKRALDREGNNKITYGSMNDSMKMNLYQDRSDLAECSDWIHDLIRGLPEPSLSRPKFKQL
ncbi:hypothetical protein HDF14_001095 [Edaphobacter lichenicola]|uniref:Uncharacterized protein n=1 Tax=Tunturiibacter gelidiferens TaxID=3069689 RepID=A0A9X0U326_9BACT|nr:hypothetical protein [Edaphobacter lichenicola]